MITVWHHEACLAFNGVITFSDVNLNDGVRDIHFNECISNVSILDFHVTLCRIRISIPGLNPGFSFLVCKKLVLLDRNLVFNSDAAQYYRYVLVLVGFSTSVKHHCNTHMLTEL